MFSQAGISGKGPEPLGAVAEHHSWVTGAPVELELLSQAELPWDPAPAVSQCPAPAWAELSAPPLGEFPPGEPLTEDLHSLALGMV